MDYLAREILIRKVEGQLAVLYRMGSDEGQHALESYLEQIERATDGGELVNL